MVLVTAKLLRTLEDVELRESQGRGAIEQAVCCVALMVAAARSRPIL